MGQRVDLHQKLIDALGTRYVYYQPPESIKLQYPCIIYSLSRLPIRYANDIPYSVDHGYDCILIDSNPESKILDRLVRLPLCKFDKPYTADNLYHYPFTIYY